MRPLDYQMSTQATSGCFASYILAACAQDQACPVFISQRDAEPSWTVRRKSTVVGVVYKIYDDVGCLFQSCRRQRIRALIYTPNAKPLNVWLYIYKKNTGYLQKEQETEKAL